MKTELIAHGWFRAAVRSAIIGLVVAVSGMGCSKEEAAKSTALTPEETALLNSNVTKGAPVPQTQAQPLATASPNVSRPAPVPQTQVRPQAPTISANPGTGADLGDLTRQVRRWIVRNQRPPSSFEEFASTSGAQIPPAPAGKKYQLTKQMSVVLVNR